MHLSVPGNLLLLGEYAVLEEGGIGLAMAVERRVRVAMHPWDELLIQGSLPGAAVSWSPGSAGSPLLASVVDAVRSWMRSSGRRDAWRTRFTVSSDELFAGDGRKLGLGSSAAVAVGLVCGLLEAACVPAEIRDRAAPGIAVSAHRAAQSGVGSGYDVLCSFHGGLGIFHGGESSSWEPWDTALPLTVATFPGAAPVATPRSVRRYRAWKEESPRQARRFLERSNERVTAFLAAYRALCVGLGDAIGVPEGLDPERCKSLGAGNELGVCLLPEQSALSLPPGVSVTPLASTGVSWSP